MLKNETLFLGRANRRLTLPFTREEYRILWNIQTLMSCLMIASLIFIGWCLLQYYETERQVNLESNSLSHIRSAKQTFHDAMVREGLTLSTSELQNIKKRSKFINRLNEKRSFSWANLLTDLSHAIPTDVSIKSVQLKFKDSLVLLNGKVKTLKKLNTLVQSLENQRMFRRVKVSNHRIEDLQGQTKYTQKIRNKKLQPTTHSVVQFQLSVAYSPILLKDE